MISNIRFWCYKVLPLVYDDSLSYYELLCKITAKINEMIPYVNEIESGVKQEVDAILTEWLNDGTLASIMPDPAHVHADDHFNIYVDPYNGDDTNDGKTYGTAVKTLDKAFDIMSEYGAGAYIHLIQPGTYELNYITVHAASIHILAEAADITVYWGAAGNNSTKKFYASYLHFSGYEVGGTRFYSRGTGEAGFEPGKIYANNVVFDGDTGARFAVYGGSAQIRNSVIRVPFRFGGSNAIIDHCELNPNVSAIGSTYTRLIEAYNGTNLTFVGDNTLTGKDSYGNMTSWIVTTACNVFIRKPFILDGIGNDIPIFGGGLTNFTGELDTLETVINSNTSLDDCTFNGTSSAGNNVQAQPRFDTGSFSETIPAGETVDVNVTFNFTFKTAPYIFTQIATTVSDVDMADIVAQPVTGSTDGSGTTIRLTNASDTARTPHVRWLALHL